MDKKILFIFLLSLISLNSCQNCSQITLKSLSFEHIDKNNDNKISPTESNNVIKELNSGQCNLEPLFALRVIQNEFSALDVNNDSFIDKQEWN